MKIKNCDWKCEEERDGICTRKDKHTSKCNCTECESFFNCNSCKNNCEQ